MNYTGTTHEIQINNGSDRWQILAQPVNLSATGFKKAARTDAAEPNDVITYPFHHFGNQVH
jgi:hypothetical protein